MSTKLPDTLAPMGDFPAVEADNVDITIDGNPKSLQQAYEDGDLGGGGSDIEVTSMPDASASYLDKVLLYVGDTGTYEYGKFYKCVSDGETPPSYSWEDAGIGSDPVDGTTIVKDSSTGELSAVQATQSTKGIVKGGNGTQIGSNGEVNVVDRLEEINALPTATADNLDKCYLLKGTQTGYQTGAIYQCQLVVGSDPAEYEWVLLSANPLTFDSDDFNVANDNVELQPSRRVYGGTRAAWNLLSVAEKTKYGATAFTDDEGGEASAELATLTGGTGVSVQTGSYCRKIGKFATAHLKLRTEQEKTTGDMLLSGLFIPYYLQSYPYIDVPFVVRSRLNNEVEPRMGYIDSHGDFYLSGYTLGVPAGLDIQLCFTYQTTD